MEFTLPNTTGNVGAISIVVAPSDFSLVAMTSNLSPDRVAMSFLSIETPFSSPTVKANIESSVDVDLGLEISYPNVLSC